MFPISEKNNNKINDITGENKLKKWKDNTEETIFDSNYMLIIATVLTILFFGLGLVFATFLGALTMFAVFVGSSGQVLMSIFKIALNIVPLITLIISFFLARIATRQIKTKEHIASGIVSLIFLVPSIFVYLFSVMFFYDLIFN